MTTETENTFVPLNRLAIWKGNVRKTGAAQGIDELAASIASQGLIVPLSVMREGKGHVVVAGQRRLMALQRLADAKTIAKDYMVPCRTVDPANALETSLAENTVRTNMHPADQFDAWRGLAENNMTPADIAARFGVTEKIVTQRLKLGRVAPPLLDLYRDEKLNLEQIMAFTVTDDQDEQLRVWDGLKDLRTWQKGPEQIRDALTNEEIPATDKRVRFVGLDAYEAAGGNVRRDLFDADNAGWVMDPALLDKMVAEKMETVVEAVKAEGWKWVETREEFDWNERRKFGEDRGKPVPLTAEQKQQLNALESELEALEELDELDDDQDARADEIREQLERLQDNGQVFSGAALKRGGAVITLDHYGQPDIRRGLVRKEDAPKAKAGQGGDDEEPAEKAKSPYSAALIVDLTKEFTGALQAELAANPHLALVTVVYAAISWHDTPASIRFTEHRTVEGSKADTALAKIGAKASKGMPDEHGDDLWGWLEKQTTDKLLAILAVHVARTVDATRNAEPLRASLALNLRTWFTPSAENYFGKVSKDQVFKDMAEMGATPNAIAGLRGSKKAEIAAAAAKQAETAADWLPEPLRPAL